MSDNLTDAENEYFKKEANKLKFHEVAKTVVYELWQIMNGPSHGKRMDLTSAEQLVNDFETADSEREIQAAARRKAYDNMRHRIDNGHVTAMPNDKHVYVQGGPVPTMPIQETVKFRYELFQVQWQTLQDMKEALNAIGQDGWHVIDQVGYTIQESEDGDINVSTFLASQTADKGIHNS